MSNLTIEELDTAYTAADAAADAAWGVYTATRTAAAWDVYTTARATAYENTLNKKEGV